MLGTYPLEVRIKKDVHSVKKIDEKVIWLGLVVALHGHGRPELLHRLVEKGACQREKDGNRKKTKTAS